MKNSVWIKSILIFLAGGITTFAYAPWYFVFILPLTLSLLFFYINTATSKKWAFVFGFLFGYAFGLGSMFWIANVTLVDTKVFSFFTILLPIVMAFIFAMFFAMPAFMSLFAPAGAKRLLAWAGWFTLFEWVRSWLFTGFPWNALGASWTGFLPVLQTVSLVGVYGLTLVTILLCSVFALGKNSKCIPVAISAFLLITVLGWLRLLNAHTDNVIGVNLRLVQPSTPQTYKWDETKKEENVRQLVRLSARKNDAVTHAIFPETAASFFVDQEHWKRANLIPAVPQNGYLITGGMRMPTNEYDISYNSVFVIDGNSSNIVSHYDKFHLVPFGEYVPKPFKFLVRNKLIHAAPDFLEGPGPQTVKIPKAPPASILICYEIIFSGQVVDKKNRPEWIINVTNDGWYGNTHQPAQHFGMAVLRAVEEGLPVVRVANNGLSGVIDAYGRIVAKTELNQIVALDSPLPKSAEKTLFSMFGNKIPVILAIICILFSFKKKKTLDK